MVGVAVCVAVGPAAELRGRRPQQFQDMQPELLLQVSAERESLDRAIIRASAQLSLHLCVCVSCVLPAGATVSSRQARPRTEWTPPRCRT